MLQLIYNTSTLYILKHSTLTVSDENTRHEMGFPGR